LRSPNGRPCRPISGLPSARRRKDSRGGRARQPAWHPDRRAVRTAVVEKVRGGRVAALDEQVWVTEVDRRDGQWARRRQDDELGVEFVLFDVVD